MFEQIFESIRKASESSQQTQQDSYRHWAQQWLSGSPNAANPSNGRARNLQKTWLEAALQLLNQHRASVDSTYKAGIQLIEQTFRVSEVKSSEDYRRNMEQLWSKLFETFKGSSEMQLREFQKWTEKSFEMAQKSQA